MNELGENALCALDSESESVIGQRRILMIYAVGEAWERVSIHSLYNFACMRHYFKRIIPISFVVYTRKIPYY